MTYAAQAAVLELPTTRARIGQFRALIIALIALALAAAMVVAESPQPTQAHVYSRSEAARIVAIAKSHLGARFRMGTTGMQYFDCSGLVFRVYAQAGLLSRIGGNRKRAAGYYAWFRNRGLTSRSNPAIGDLVWWTKHGRIVHMGLYIGNGRALSALTTGVRVHSLGGISVNFLAFGHARLDR